MRTNDRRIFEFAEFRLDMAEHVLTRNGQAISLRPKLFELLVFFLEHRGEVLEKDEITSGVWGSLSQGSADQPSANLTVNISNLRQALGDDSEKPMFIETLPHRGYRFIALVRVAEPRQARQAETRLAAVSAVSGGGHQVFSSTYETAAATVAPRWAESASNAKVAAPASAADQAESLARPEQSRRVPKLSRRALVVVSIALLAITTFIMAWAMGKPNEAPQPEAVNSYGNLTGKEPANAPHIDFMEPASPLAWIGDKPLKIHGSGFQPGSTVLMVFPSGGSATLNGVAVQNVTSNELTMIVDFNNNPGQYRIRVNSPEGTNSSWFVFDVSPANLLPVVTEVRQIGTSNGKVRIAVSGSNFSQSVHAVVLYPDGQKDYLPGPRVSGESFQGAFDPRGMTGTFQLQIQNMGKGSNVVSFNVSNP